MSFWELPAHGPEDTVLIDADGAAIAREALLERVRTLEDRLAGFRHRSFGFLLCANRVEDIALLLACLRRGHVPLLLAADMPKDQLEELIAHYGPDWITGRDGLAGPLPLPAMPPATLHPALGLLLSTSGSTGSPRLVRLSREALQANAASISDYLALSPDERAITSLPMNYSYGLSIINSHLLTGGTLVLNNDRVISREFLQRLQVQRVTSLAGVPYVYQMLLRTGFFKQPVPSLRTLTQAGGKLDDRMTRLVAEAAEAIGLRFFVMYGQTEACARISYVPPERLSEKIGSIGIAIPGGTLSVAPDSGELIYEGPNVMLGYAERPADLALGDELGGRLATGDLGHADADGFFYVTGRLKRFVKIGGNRIGLDEVEQALQGYLHAPVSVGGKDDGLVVWIESDSAVMIETARTYLRSHFTIHHSMVKIKLVDDLPLLPTGKKDYSPLLSSQ
ncbi:MAG: AMP-binding protein [Roseateles sp.]|uniref:AMP-binding protein n=1 Tax=Roseateles sp. TaxID=1971397 RepID=UPI0039EC5FF7